MARNPKLDPDLMQIRTLSAKTGKSVIELREIFKSVGLLNSDGTARFYATDKVSLVAAFKALGIDPESDPAETPDAATTDALEAPESKLSALAQAARDADASAPAPAPASTGSGNETDDPISEAIMEGEISEFRDPFPLPTHPRSDMYYWPMNINPNRQMSMQLRGWRAVTSDSHMREIRPDGVYFRLRTAAGRIRFQDLELWCIPRRVHDRWKAARNVDMRDRGEAAVDAFKENVDAAKAGLRRRLGHGGDQHIDYVEFDDREAGERASFDRAKKSGDSPIRSRAFVGRNTESR